MDELDLRVGRCTLFDLNFRPHKMSVEQLESGVMELWRDTGNTEAVGRRVRRYLDTAGAS